MNLNKGLKPVVLLCGSALHLLANAQDIDAEIEVSLPVVEVQAESLQQRVYTREQMDATPQSNRDLAGLIADNPAIRSANESAGTTNKGSLAPESFSIHGESPYQNQFQIDGINATNIINPHRSEPAIGGGNEDLSSYSQSYNIDTDLLDQVDVYDSRVPVEFSGFTGGVIDAKIKKPTGSGDWKIKHSFNSSHLTQQNFAKDSGGTFVENYENGAPGFTPAWEKHFSSVIGDVTLNEDIKALLSFSRRTSEIQRTQRVLDPSLNIISSLKDLVEVESNKSDSVDNFLSKVETRINGADLSLTLKYASRYEETVSNGTGRMGVDWDYGQKSYGLGLDYLKPTSTGALSLKLGFDKMSSFKSDEESDLYTDTYLAPSVFVSVHGGYGDISEDQNQYSLKIRHDWTGFNILGAEHKFYAGIDYQDVSAEFNRVQDQNVYNNRVVNGVRTLWSHNIYQQGTVQASQKKIGLYLADSISWKNIDLTFAARLDRENLLKRSNFSPRVGFDWDLNGDGVYKFGAGWSRYFGMEMLGYALEREKRSLLKHVVSSGSPAVAYVPEVHDFSGLKTPYSDELVFSFSRNINDLILAKAQYVHRVSRDGISMETYKLGSESDPKGHIYANNGRSNTETVMLGLHSLKKLNFAGAKWMAGLDFSWQDTERNNNVNNGWESELYDGDTMINVDGVLMETKDKPQLELLFPRKINISWSADWGNYGLVWGNRLNWNSSRDRLIHSGINRVSINGAMKNVHFYKTTKMPSYWSLDTMLTYKPQVIKGAVFTIEIINVLNQSRETKGLYTNNVSEGGRMQAGREIWLNASYEF